LHGGENVKRGTRVANEHLLLLPNFAAHMNILYTDIKTLKDTLYGKSNPVSAALIRVGHGIAFTSQQIYTIPGLDEGFGHVDVIDTMALSPAVIAWAGQRSFEITEMSCDFRAMRKFLRENRIPIELNMTSNDMLVTDVFSRDVGRRNLNPLSHLRAMLDEGLFVVIGTDDDGIWPIHKCQSHYSHISVASEVCNAIFTCNLTGAEVLGLLNRANQARFQPMQRRRRRSATI